MPDDQDPAQGPPADGEVNVVLTLNFKPGTTDAVLAGITPLIEPTRNEAGNDGFDVFRVTARPDTLVIVERWQDKAALEKHWALPGTGKVLDLFRDNLAEPLTDGANVLYLTRLSG